MNCPTCGAENSDDARFCAECGSPLDDQDIEATLAGQIIDVTDDDVTILSTPDRLISESETVAPRQINPIDKPDKGKVPPLPPTEASDVEEKVEEVEAVEPPPLAVEESGSEKTTLAPQADLAQAARQALSPEAGTEQISQPFADLGSGQNKRLLMIGGGALLVLLLLLCCCSLIIGAVLGMGGI